MPADAVVARRRGVCALVMASMLMGCEPGWHYEAPGGTAVPGNALRFEVKAATDLTVRVSADASADLLHAEVTLTPTGATPSVLKAPSLTVVDARGVSLPEQRPLQSSCPLIDGRLVIPPGVACTLAGSFQIRPLVRHIVFARKNPDLSSVTLKVRSDDSCAPVVSVPLTWRD
jgi:hypothetical protein